LQVAIVYVNMKPAHFQFHFVFVCLLCVCVVSCVPVLFHTPAGVDGIVHPRVVSVPYRSIKVDIEVKSITEECDVRCAAILKAASINDKKLKPLPVEDLLGLTTGTLETGFPLLEADLFSQACWPLPSQPLAPPPPPPPSPPPPPPPPPTPEPPMWLVGGGVSSPCREGLLFVVVVVVVVVVGGGWVVVVVLVLVLVSRPRQLARSWSTTWSARKCPVRRI
jgi:hypothetical protein